MAVYSPIPILMYHTVGKPIKDWRWSFLTVPAEIFEDQLLWLKKKDYKTVGLEEVYDHVLGKKPLQGNNVVLTFDDGYLDNWTHAAPLLRKYGFRAVVYVNPEFVDPAGAVRPTLDDVWQGRMKEDDLDTAGFMSWKEIRNLSDEGTFSVQSHLMTHTWYPVSDRIVDFHHPEDEYYWLDWNAQPGSKPFYLKGRPEESVPYGVPVYENSKAATARIYHPDPSEEEHFVDYVRRHGGLSFFNRKDWKEALFSEVERFRNGRSLTGNHETDAEYAARLDYELKQSKALLEQHLEQPVDFLAWPGGGYDEHAVKAAQAVYRSVTLGSRDRSGVLNRIGDDPGFIKRIGVPYIEKGGAICYPGGRYLHHRLQEFCEKRGHRFQRQVLKLKNLVF